MYWALSKRHSPVKGGEIVIKHDSVPADEEYAPFSLEGERVAFHREIMQEKGWMMKV
jgi:hypothetical protein